MRKPLPGDNEVSNVQTFLNNLARGTVGLLPHCLSAAKRAAYSKTRAGDSHRFVVAMFTECLCGLITERVREEYKDTDANHALLSMPQPRKPSRVRAAALTKVEQRAVRAQDKLAEWQRKQKLAATKIRKYRKQVSYYKRKGTL